jgi:hypothetical protein
MRNLLSKGLVMFAGVTGIPALAVAQIVTQPAEKAQIRSNEDPRILSLRRFFQRNNSPAQHLSDVFIREADNNGLDWRLLPGLALIESGGGKHCQKFNLFGWMNGRASFESFSDGIRQVAWHLSNSRYYKNKSVSRMLLTYNKDPMYRVRVMSAMRLISPSVEIAMAGE